MALADDIKQSMLRAMKAQGQKIVALTAYDHLFAQLLDRAGVEVLLVGDSVATVMQGRDTTVPVTMDQMVYHCELVDRACKRALVVGDLPFLSYQVGIEDALRNAGRLMKEGLVEAVKLEGGRDYAETVQRLVAATAFQGDIHHACAIVQETHGQQPGQQEQFEVRGGRPVVNQRAE